jgi:hypothetical protein
VCVSVSVWSRSPVHTPTGSLDAKTSPVRRSPCCSSWNGKKPIHSKAVSTPGMPSLCPGMPSLCQSSPGLGLVSRSTGRYTIPETAQEMSIYVMQE